MRHIQLTGLICFGLFLTLPHSVLAADRAAFSTPELTVRVVIRKPEQLAAFYEARGFNKAMVKEITRQCFIGVLIKNTSQHVILHDLSQWQFFDSKGEIPQLDRKHWRKKWTSMNIPLAHQSTFRWTLLPEKLDFRPDEKEGGNVLLPPRKGPIRIKANFILTGSTVPKTIPVEFNNLECAL